MSFGNRLKQAREGKGYNQKQFAEKLEITATRLNYWEQTVKIGINTDVFYMTLSK